jgi:hypothetical protein
VASIEAYGHGYVAIDIQLLVSLLDGEDHTQRLPAISSCSGKILSCQNGALKVSIRQEIELTFCRYNTL